MKAKLTYLVVFLVAVALTMTVFIVFNQEVNDIFNLKPAKAENAEKETPKDFRINLTRDGNEKIKQFIEYKSGRTDEYPPRVMFPDKRDTIIQTVYKDSVLLAKYNQLKTEMADMKSMYLFRENEITLKNDEIKKLESRLNLGKDSVYTFWKKNTVKMFESMDSQKAAEVLATFSEDMARELLYSMKKKKAAEILSLMNAEKVLTLTKAEK